MHGAEWQAEQVRDIVKRQAGRDQAADLAGERGGIIGTVQLALQEPRVADERISARHGRGSRENRAGRILVGRAEAFVTLPVP